jgi:dTDP-4-dehydrorhamnose 3,5-epimerase
VGLRVSLSMFQVEATPVEGVKVLRPHPHRDERGEFVKTFHADQFRDSGMDFVPREQFFSTSSRNVLRGLHFQEPPFDGSKLVFCAAGRILDVVVDLRRSKSPGAIFSRELESERREMVFVPKGCAHGFLALEDNSTVFYLTDSMHVSSHDKGILWNSIDFEWGAGSPIVSKRDLGFVSWADFQSPFP